eukprot:TRINITY_DN22154_c0_g1_i3.p1 TRINITY_DN22154_c0_g1~~TRINITY_DN22154_c0_g1_i3.p1  ORF type:complete len:107 (+),score=44.30 TRINITY_DN22154_c0_g1_i3:37-357(+)
MEFWLLRFCFLEKLLFFFFKQKTAYEMQRGLVGSEMCIRDRYQRRVHGDMGKVLFLNAGPEIDTTKKSGTKLCLLYTSDAADDTPCVDLGGRRIIKKKKQVYFVTC